MFSTGGVGLPVQKAAASSCIWYHGRQYCPSDYWHPGCIWQYGDIYCRVYKKKYYQGGGGGGGY
jgi:hypothetical protein